MDSQGHNKRRLLRKFSSDRTISEDVSDIWKVKAVPQNKNHCRRNEDNSWVHYFLISMWFDTVKPSEAFGPAHRINGSSADRVRRGAGLSA